MPPLYHAYYAPQNLYSNASDPEAFMRGLDPESWSTTTSWRRKTWSRPILRRFLKPHDVHSIMSSAWRRPRRRDFGDQRQPAGILGAVDWESERAKADFAPAWRRPFRRG